MKSLNKLSTGFLALALIFSAGCKKKKDTVSPANNSYDVPTSYSSFSNAEYSEATIRLNMFKTIENEMKKALNTPPTADATKLKNMFKNASGSFTDSTQWNGNNIQLEDHVDPNAQTLIEGFFDTYVAASGSANAATFGTSTAVGTAGIGTGNAANGSKKTLFDEHGINYAQSFQKVMFGSFLIYQIDNILGNIANQDNSANVSGQNYTAQEHAWDLAFGYLGFTGKYTVDSLTNTSFIAAHKAQYFYIANYSTQVDAGMHSSSALLNAFLKGRAAISNKDDATRDEQAALIIAELEKFLAGCVLHELNELTASSNLKFNDSPSKCSSLSESMGFLVAMKYNPRKVTISDAQIDDILSHYHATYSLDGVVLVDDVSYIRTQVSTIYGMQSVKDVI